MDTIEIFTQNRCEFVNITRLVESSLKKSAIRSGIGVIFCPHTTAGLTINECGTPMLFMTPYIGLRNRSQKISLSSYMGRVTATVTLKPGCLETRLM